MEEDSKVNLAKNGRERTGNIKKYTNCDFQIENLFTRRECEI